jgi:hypothetical protein
MTRTLLPCPNDCSKLSSPSKRGVGEIWYPGPTTVTELSVEARVERTRADRRAGDGGLRRDAWIADSIAIRDEEHWSGCGSEDRKHASELERPVRRADRCPRFAVVDPLGQALSAVAADVVHADGKQRIHVHRGADLAPDTEADLRSDEAAAHARERDRLVARILGADRQDLAADQDARRLRIIVAPEHLVVGRHDTGRAKGPTILVE